MNVKLKNKRSYNILLGGVLLYSSYLNAACIQNPNYRNILSNLKPETFSIQYDDTSVRVLANYKLIYYPGYTNTYSGNNGRCGNAGIVSYYLNGWVPNSDNIAETNIPGIGIRIKWGRSDEFFLNFKHYRPEDNGYRYRINDSSWTVEIIKTGQVTQSGALKGGALARTQQENNFPYNSTWIYSTLRIPNNAVKINSLKCTTYANNYNINLGTWYDTQFKNIGNVSQNKTIPIKLSCAAGTNIKATVTSNAGYIDASSGKLKLSGANQATGIGIQIIDENNNPVALNTPIRVRNNTSSGDYIFNWKARYIKTGNVIKPGSANSTAVVNILYE